MLHQLMPTVPGTAELLPMRASGKTSADEKDFLQSSQLFKQAVKEY